MQQDLPDLVPPADTPAVTAAADATAPAVDRGARLAAWRDELLAWVRTLAQATVYATLVVTFVMQVARVEGQSMAPTLADQDRLIVNKLSYQFSSPQRGDIVMLYYPLDPEKSYVKRVIAEEGDSVRVVDGDGQLGLELILVLDDQHVGKINRGCMHLKHHLSFFGFRRGNVLDHQAFGWSILLAKNSFHDVFLLRPYRRAIE